MGKRCIVTKLSPSSDIFLPQKSSISYNYVHANFESRCIIIRKCKDKRGAFAMRLKFTQRPSDYPPQIRHLDLSDAEDIADSIALLRDENDKLRKIAASLSVETENIRRSLAPAKSTPWWLSSRLKALP